MESSFLPCILMKYPKLFPLSLCVYICGSQPERDGWEKSRSLDERSLKEVGCLMSLMNSMRRLSLVNSHS